MGSADSNVSEPSLHISSLRLAVDGFDSWISWLESVRPCLIIKVELIQGLSTQSFLKNGNMCTVRCEFYTMISLNVDMLRLKVYYIDMKTYMIFIVCVCLF